MAESYIKTLGVKYLFYHFSLLKNYKVVSEDYWGRQRVEGYGHLTLPTLPGCRNRLERGNVDS